MVKIYALYKGDKFIMTGTIYQISNYLGVKQSTVKFYSMPTYLKRDKGNRKRVIRIEG